MKSKGFNIIFILCLSFIAIVIIDLYSTKHAINIVKEQPNMFEKFEIGKQRNVIVTEEWRSLDMGIRYVHFYKESPIFGFKCYDVIRN